ncbi:MAG: electron transfer flavoprotein subunit beta/FixA family protein [Planctomycetota bacterium]|nr:electron transfer flavoprotein subunit beta/FixA family protein [Planctomycetota bacterium]
MEIIVLIKRVVATDTRVKIGADGTSIDTAGVQYIMAPYDEIAVEKAIQLKTEAGEGKVTVLTVGPNEATKELRTALAMGADEAVHLTVDGTLDAAATAGAIHAGLEGRSFDLILCGKQATDVDDAAVGPRLAALLDLPSVAFASALTIEDGKAVVSRENEGVTEVYEVDLPAVLTAQKGLAEPRYPSLKGIMKAKKKPLATDAATAPENGSTVEALNLPPARADVVTIEPTPEGMQQLLAALRNDKKVL